VAGARGEQEQEVLGLERSGQNKLPEPADHFGVLGKPALVGAYLLGVM
jgi:hypothetical protein